MYISVVLNWTIMFTYIWRAGIFTVGKSDLYSPANVQVPYEIPVSTNGAWVILGHCKLCGTENIRDTQWVKPIEDLRNSIHKCIYKWYGAIFCRYISLFDLLDSLEGICLIKCKDNYEFFCLFVYLYLKTFRCLYSF